ncbi:MAG: sigma 54-interacting transcriptional regulator [Deltaproteobacteria bacterium]|nr:sigma 54-interacting transcriptional regulator [Deltaproteobacteria bacterium]
MSDQNTRTLKENRPKLKSGEAIRPGVLVLFAEEGSAELARVHVGQLETTIGRQADQQVFIEDSSLSRCHAVIAFGPREITLRDLGSHNGTQLNGSRFHGEAKVVPGDVVRCGSTVLMVVPDVAAYKGWPKSALVEPLLGGPVMEQVRRRLDVLATQPVEVLICGESGTGKDVAARYLHTRSGCKGDYVPLNCAAVPEALFEAELFGATKGAFTGAVANRSGLMQAARGGTLFLDEIGELPLSLQPKLLRAVELREVRQVGSNQLQHVDLRLAAATNRDLAQEVECERFRADLYHRLCGAQVQIPPLRARRDDIVIFAERFLAHHQASFQSAPAVCMSAAFVERLLLGAWKGNVRELERMLREALVQATMEQQTCLQVEHLPAISLAGAQGEGEDEEIMRLRRALTTAGGNVSRAAAELGMRRGRVYELLKVHGLVAEDFR